MAAVEGEIKVRRHPLVAAELMVVTLVLFVVGAVDAAIDDIPTPYWIRGVRRKRWRARLVDVHDVRVTSSRRGRRTVEVVTAEGVHELAAPRGGILVRDPHLERLAADLRSEVPVV